MSFQDKLEVNQRPIVLYDMSIEDVQERAVKKLIFPSVTKAANFLGYRITSLCTSLKCKNYVYSRADKKKYAIRYYVEK